MREKNGNREIFSSDFSVSNIQSKLKKMFFTEIHVQRSLQNVTRTLYVAKTVYLRFQNHLFVIFTIHLEAWLDENELPVPYLHRSLQIQLFSIFCDSVTLIKVLQDPDYYSFSRTSTFTYKRFIYQVFF